MLQEGKEPIAIHSWSAVVHCEYRSGRQTFAPAATAFLTRAWHWVRLCDMLDVEHICPIACNLDQYLSRHGRRATVLTTLAMFAMLSVVL